MTWKEELIEVLKALGGEAGLREIYELVESRGNKQLSSKWKATVRGCLERASSDSMNFDGTEDLFYSASGLGEGIWGLRNYEPTYNTMDITQDDISFAEGRQKIKTHIVRERNHHVITLAKQKALKKHGVLTCEICGFDFVKYYGELGKDFVEGHHIKPVSELSPGERTRVEDIVLLCSNCHSMIHRRKPWLSKEELKSLLVKNDV